MVQANDNSDSELLRFPLVCGPEVSGKPDTDLIWRLLDDGELSREQLETLGRSLSNSEAAREEYLNAVMLHLGLVEIFGPEKTAADLPFPTEPVQLSSSMTSIVKSLESQ